MTYGGHRADEDGFESPDSRTTFAVVVVAIPVVLGLGGLALGAHLAFGGSGGASDPPAVLGVLPALMGLLFLAAAVWLVRSFTADDDRPAPRKRPGLGPPPPRPVAAPVALERPSFRSSLRAARRSTGAVLATGALGLVLVGYAVVGARQESGDQRRWDEVVARGRPVSARVVGLERETCGPSNNGSTTCRDKQWVRVTTFDDDAAPASARVGVAWNDFFPLEVGHVLEASRLGDRVALARIDPIFDEGADLLGFGVFVMATPVVWFLGSFALHRRRRRRVRLP